jgi:AraC-like DNA-binding protein
MRNLWAFENAEGEFRDFAGVGRTEFSDGPFQGYMEYQSIADGIGFYRLEGSADRDYTLSAAEHSPYGMMIIGCMLSGSGRVSAKGSDDQIWQDEARLYAITPFGRRTNYHVTARKPWRSMALKIDAGIVDRVANDHVPGVVRQAVGNGGAPMSTSRPMTPGLVRLAEELVAPIYRGRMGELYREAKVLELLALQLDALAEDPVDQRQLTAREIARVRDAHDRLLGELGETPGLHDLASAVGLTPKRLNLGFRLLYGRTVFDLLRDARLDAARKLLSERPDLPLKQIAWTVGYAQATNFISAYRRRFGVPPGRHKRLTRD